MKQLTCIVIFILVFMTTTGYGQQHINGGSGQGLMAAVPEAQSSEKLKSFKNITPENGLGWWRLNVNTVGFAAQGLLAVIDFDVDIPSSVRGYNASGGEKHYVLNELGANIRGSVKFRITGAYTDPRNKERKTFTHDVKVWKFGKSKSEELELFGYTGSVKDMTISQLLAKLDVKITSIEPIEKDISGYTRADQEVGKIIEKAKKETSLNSQIRYAQTAESFGRIDEAIQKYEEAYKAKADPTIREKIEELKSKKKTQEDQKLSDVSKKPQQEDNTDQAPNSSNNNPNNTSSNNSSGGITLSSERSSSSSGASSQKSATTKSSSSKSNSSRKNERANSTKPEQKKYAFNGREYTYEQLKYEQQKYKEEQERKQQMATNPAGYILQESGVKNYFEAESDRLSREADEQSAALDRRLVAQKRAREAEQRKKEREIEEIIQRRVDSHKASEEQRRQEYQKKGGDANYAKCLQYWEGQAKNSIKQINDYLFKFKGQMISFDVPRSNCDYVEAIENIQNSNMPTDYKSVLIGNVMDIRVAYNDNFQENGYLSQINLEYNGGVYSDDLSWVTGYAQCGNYLDYIDKVLNYKSSFYRNFGKDDKWTIKNQYIRYDNHYSSIGRYNQSKQFIDEVRNTGISIAESNFDYFSFEENIIHNFHRWPTVWSENKKPNSETRKLYVEYDKELIKSEIDKFLVLYQIKRKYALNTVVNEKDMAFFLYNIGNVKEAYKHYLRFIFMYNSVIGKGQHKLWDLIRNDQHQDEFYIEVLNAVLLGVVLNIEKQQYVKGLELLEMLETSNKKSTRTLTGAYSKQNISNAVKKLKNQLFYRMGEYDRMQLIKDKEEFRDLVEYAKSMEDFLGTEAYLVSLDLPLQINALIKLGKADLAKAIYKHCKIYYYYKKGKHFFGSPTDFEAFTEATEVLFPKRKTSITTSKLVGLDILHRSYYSNYEQKSSYIFLTRNDVFELQETENLMTIDLSTDGEYKKQMEALGNELKQIDLSSVKKLNSWWTNYFSYLHNTYHQENIIHNETGKFFLIEYIQTGIMLGKFHEVIPAMAEFDLYYKEAEYDLLLERSILKLMWQYSGIGTTPYTRAIGDPLYSESKNGSFFSPSPLKNYFDNEVQKNSSNITMLKKYLNNWNHLKISSPIIPYLYKIIEINKTLRS